MNIDEVIQYGALGLLALVLFWLGRIMDRVVDRAMRAFDGLIRAVDALNAKIDEANKNQASELRALSGRLAKVQVSVSALRQNGQYQRLEEREFEHAAASEER